MNPDPKLPRNAGAASGKHMSEPFMDRLRAIWKGAPAEEPEPTLVSELNETEAEHESRLVSNAQAFHDLAVDDVMVPRAEIIAVEVGMAFDDLLKYVAANTHSRLPVYRETLDDVIGVFHIRDVVDSLANGTPFELEKIVRPVPIVAPSMRAFDLLREMRRNRTHIALVTDEFGGIDGLVTIEDLIEEIVGNIEDEHDRDTFSELVEEADGSVLVDARMPVEQFEENFGSFLQESEREDFDTVGGLIWAIAGHIAAIGEVVHHPSGAQFEVIDADDRRIKRVRARRSPAGAVSDASEAVN
jgi:CBS domain containing-hemolysin-like protein